ncbi:MAG: nitroreductase family protein [Acidimicrobiaceae bacterium]|jgi:nitroreductase|nr:nitroreductase family protein [Acidimicrobiaceae bacterium]MDC1388620.1 nitroreductase family protein [Acidimicrobiales bacterium]MDG1088469.1 nitroreductase family protein [Acidimicrobiales bacterium]HAY69048.1 nitroreductase [Acidimicrobiaceae bacterium]
MELYDVMRTTFACREWTDDPVSDETLHRILDNARFAPNGGNRQGQHVIVVRDKDVRRQLVPLVREGTDIYMAHVAAGEAPWNSINPTSVDEAAIRANDRPVTFPGVNEMVDAPVVLVVAVDLSVVASFDKNLERIGVISGASIYPLVWNILMSARNEGLGGVLTTYLAEKEPEVQKVLGLPSSYAVAAMLPIGVPVKQLTKLRRKQVEEFVTVDSFDGPAFTVDS